MDAESVLLRRGFRRLEVAVELALPDTISFRWAGLQRDYRRRRHHVLLFLLGQAHRADALWSHFPSMGRYFGRVRIS